MLVDQNFASSQFDVLGGGGLAGWMVTKVSIDSNYFLIYYLLPLLWSHREGYPMPDERRSI